MWIAEKDASIVDQIERDLATLDGAARAAVDGRLTTFEHDSLAERRDAARYCRGRLRLRGIGEGNPESLDALIALTAENAHRPEDMERALAALAQLKGDEMFRAAGALRARLHSQHEWTRDQTYALLGRLRATGSPLGYYRTIQAGVSPQAPPGAGGFHALVRDVRRRLSTAGSLARDAAAREARRFSAGFLWTVTAWAAAGASLISIHLAATLEAQPAATFYTVYVVAVLVSSVALAASAVRRLSPIWLHYDRGAAAVQQAFAAAAWVLGPALIGVGILLASISFSNRLTNWIVALVAAPLSISVFVAIIRLGTILGFGLVGGERQLPDVTPFRRLWYSRRVRGVLETLVGASCGVLTTAVLLWLARRLHPHADIDEVSRLIEGMWLFLTPTSAAIASAFSLVDHFPITRAAADPRQAARASDANRATAMRNPAELYRSFRTTITPRRVLAVALLVPLGMALALVIDDVRTWKPRIDMAPPGQTVTALQSITDLPTRRDFRVAFPQRVVATIPEQLVESPSAGSRPDLSLTLIEWTPGTGDRRTRAGLHTPHESPCGRRGRSADNRSVPRLGVLLAGSGLPGSNIGNWPVLVRWARAGCAGPAGGWPFTRYRRSRPRAHGGAVHAQTRTERRQRERAVNEERGFRRRLDGPPSGAGPHGAEAGRAQSGSGAGQRKPANPPGRRLAP